MTEFMRGVIAADRRLVLRRLRELCANPPSPSKPGGRRTINLVRLAVLASSVAMMLPGAWGHSVTVVEFAHLPAGLAAWERGSQGVYRVCGPASKLLYALPAYLAGVRVDYPVSFDTDVESRREWELGRIFQKQNSQQYHDIYRWSRLLPILVTILGGCLICEWSTRLFGPWPGIVSLCLWCWMPPVLAHGSLVTSDIASAVLMVLAARSLWAFLLSPGPLTALWAGIVLGVAQSTKLSLLILTPCWIVLLCCRVLQVFGKNATGPSERRTSSMKLVALGMGLLAVSVIALDACYSFQHVGFTLEQWESGWSSIGRALHGLGDWRATAWMLHVPLPIPMELLRGLDFQMADTERVQSAYLLGESKLGGWWYWYAGAALIKVPLPVLALFAFALFHLPRVMRQPGPMLWAGLCLIIPAFELALVIAGTTGTSANAAFRYMIPSLALLTVWAGRAWNACSQASLIGTASFLAWLLLNAITGLPDLIGWQNEVGWVWNQWSSRPALVGDSLDWGQDLGRLSGWISRHSRDGSTLVCVYGLGEGEPYGLRPPSARATSDSGDRPTYLAVSENLILGYHADQCVEIAGGRSSLSKAHYDTLINFRSWIRVGRTIRIYRRRDLPFKLD